MCVLRAALPLLMALLAFAAGAGAQSTTGVIRGHVGDPQGNALPGVTITLASAGLQGTLTTTSTAGGDFLFAGLPAGSYTATFEMAGFDAQQATIAVAAGQEAPVAVTLSVSTLAERIVVTAPASSILLGTTQVGVSFRQPAVSLLPNNRDISSTLLMAPGVHPTGPGGNYSISGAMSFENLFLVNGVTVNENLRGQPEMLYIEDAIQETTVATAGISAEYGRFTGGVVNMITKSGGNDFGGSFRETLHNDDWRARVAGREGDTFASDVKLDDVVPTHEYTFGGPVLKDRLWFFTAGRLQTQRFNRQLIFTNIPYVFTSESQRYEGKGTFALGAGHRLQGTFTGMNNRQTNATFNTAASMDLNSLENRSQPETLTSVTYTGALTPALFVEARYSARNMTLKGIGSRYTDPVRGTLLMTAQGLRWWSATFCGVCEPEERDNSDFFAKGTYFKAAAAGSHSVSFGVDVFNDKRKAQNHQTGSGFRFSNVNAIEVDGVLYPQVGSNVAIVWRPIFVESQGTDFRTISGFVNDSWAPIPRLTVNLGMRLDRNRGTNGAGTLVANGTAFSPRLGFTWDARGDERWVVSGSAARYVTNVLNSIADTTSPGGNADLYAFAYTGPSFNIGAQPLVPTEDVLRQMFQWFDDNGGVQLPLLGSPAVRGVSAVVNGSLKSPHSWEYAAGLSRQIGDRAAFRNDFVYRNFNDFYTVRTDMTTGRVTDTRPYAPAAVYGRSYDLSYVENSSALDRQYAAWVSQFTYRASARLDVGLNYTLSRLWGNVDGESTTAGPLTADLLHYPEYKQASWYAPEGDLSSDQRHRARLWLNAALPRLDGLIVSVQQAIESGTPYGAVAAVGGSPSTWLPNPGYLTPPDGSQILYYFTARDAYRTEGQRRTDVAIHYAKRLPLLRNLEIFGQAQVINLFNQSQLCGCGGSVFQNGGAVQLQYIDQNVRTAAASSSYRTFNPLVETPVEGVNWATGPAFGRANSRFAYTTPRMLRVTFGLRF